MSAAFLPSHQPQGRSFQTCFRQGAHNACHPVQRMIVYVCGPCEVNPKNFQPSLLLHPQPPRVVRVRPSQSHPWLLRRDQEIVHDRSCLGKREPRSIVWSRATNNAHKVPPPRPVACVLNRCFTLQPVHATWPFLPRIPPAPFSRFQLGTISFSHGRSIPHMWTNPIETPATQCMTKRDHL